MESVRLRRLLPSRACGGDDGVRRAPARARTVAPGGHRRRTENPALAIASIKAGAADYFPAPVDRDALVGTLRKLSGANTPAAETAAFAGIVGVSSAIRQVKASLAKVAASDTSVLITGETGTGKELVARRVAPEQRAAGGRSCRSIAPPFPTALIESELFGHEGGAFTGADSGARRAVQRRPRRTLLLDEMAR